MASDNNIKASGRLPELLSPAGTRQALEAAIEGGADAVYLGGTSFNARINAGNFDEVCLRDAIRLAHMYGVKIYVTLNTMIYDRELDRVLHEADIIADAGTDGIITADAGAAAYIHRHIPGLPLHASTQMSAHNADAGKLLSTLGYSRMVLAREVPLNDIKYAVANNPLEIEMFVHGALCVCQSGQCLFSSLVGGRSGNRGECAQPCRLPYSFYSAHDREVASSYPLSLKDLTLANHIPELISSGVSSLKIEGRMKSPEYVLVVTRVFRRLLDERRSARPEEMRELSDIFSRGGFTDGYFVKNVNKSMLGVRSDDDKQTTRGKQNGADVKFTGLSRRVPIKVCASLTPGAPSEMTVSGSLGSVTVTGDVPQEAVNAPLSRDDVLRCITKLGNTQYEATDSDASVNGRLMLPISRLNALRRAATDAYDALRFEKVPEKLRVSQLTPANKQKPGRTARFYEFSRIPDCAWNYFDIIYIPLWKIADVKLPDNAVGKMGVIMPPVIFDSQKKSISAMLTRAATTGFSHVLVRNIGHIEMALASGMKLHGDYRFNCANRETAALLESVGIPDVIASPEATLPQLRDLRGDISAVVYGRIPLMTLEKCIIRDISSCNICDGNAAALRDRRGVVFPVLREYEHRNIVFNSVPVNMSDRQAQLDKNGIVSRHFIFTTETKEEAAAVIEAFVSSSPIPGNIRRL